MPDFGALKESDYRQGTRLLEADKNGHPRGGSFAKENQRRDEDTLKAYSNYYRAFHQVSGPHGSGLGAQLFWILSEPNPIYCHIIQAVHVVQD